MNERGKSDGCVVPAKLVNKAAAAVAELVEERRPAKGNMASKTHPDTVPDRVRQVRWTVCVKWHKETRLVHPFLGCVFAFDPRQEPSAVVPLAGICAGGRP